jgi:hypothetical protein
MSLVTFPKIDQGTDEWHAVRRGLVTASVVGKLISVGSPDALSVDCSKCGAKVNAPCLSLSVRQKGPAPIKTLHEARTSAAANLPPVYSVANNDTSRALTATLAAERIAGWTEDTPMTSDMYRGWDVEPIARESYAKGYGPVQEIGFMRLDEDWGSLGYSPDGLVGDDGLLEIKAPRTKGHVLTVIADEVPAYNMPQLQAGLLVSGRKWIDFVPYVGGLPMWVKRVYPDPAWFAVIKDAVAQFEETAAQMVAAYTTATEGLAPTERVLDFNAPVELKLA